MMCDMGVLSVCIHYKGSHLTCTGTREGHAFSLASELTATVHKQRAKTKPRCSYCGSTAGQHDVKGV